MTTYNTKPAVSTSSSPRGVITTSYGARTDTGYFNVTFTKVTSTNNMIPFIVTVSILLLLMVVSLFTVDTKPMISAFNDILYK